jgi:hypothetical protein
VSNGSVIDYTGHQLEGKPGVSNESVIDYTGHQLEGKQW